jgi:stage IV sporulation protein FB
MARGEEAGLSRVQITSYDEGLELRIGELPPIWIHVGLPLITLFIAFPLWHRFEPTRLIAAAVVIVGMMLSALAHELGHALTARHFGLTPMLIRLHARGGEAIMHGEPWTRAQDALITLAGPLANIAIGLLCLLGHALLPVPEVILSAEFPFRQPPPVAPTAALLALSWLGWINLAWGAVNLLPAYPLDGGHLLHSAIAARRGPDYALYWTGLLGTILAIIAKYVFIGAALAGMVIWSPPYLRPNLKALKAARRHWPSWVWRMRAAAARVRAAFTRRRR